MNSILTVILLIILFPFHLLAVCVDSQSVCPADGQIPLPPTGAYNASLQAPGSIRPETVIPAKPTPVANIYEANKAGKASAPAIALKSPKGKK